MQASIRRVPFGNCFQTPSTWTLIIGTAVSALGSAVVAVALIGKLEKGFPRLEKRILL
jgi:hypothetical protein